MQERIWLDYLTLFSMGSHIILLFNFYSTLQSCHCYFIYILNSSIIAIFQIPVFAIDIAFL